MSTAPRERLTVRQEFYLSRSMDAAIRKAAAEDAGEWNPISVSDWIRGAIMARLEARKGQPAGTKNSPSP